MIVTLIKEDGYVKNLKKAHDFRPKFDKLNLKYGFYSKNQQIGSISGDIIDNELNANFNFMEEKYHMEEKYYFGHEDLKDYNLKSAFSLMKDCLTGKSDLEMTYYNGFLIKNANGDNVGSLQNNAIEENGKFNYYFTLNIDGYSFDLYFVRNSGLKSYYYCIYNNNELVAMSLNPNVKRSSFISSHDSSDTISSSPRIEEQQFDYNIYIKNDSVAKYVCLFVYLMNIIDYENPHELVSAIISSNFQSKFDPNFINEIRSSENMEFLPENMSIIKEKNAQRKKYVKNIMKNRYASFIIFIIIFFIVSIILIFALLSFR